MKSNGKNLLMFAYSTHDYMDIHPEQNFRTIESHERMNEFVEHMRKNWSGGTISDVHEVTPQEYYKARQSRYWKGCEEALDNLAMDCKPEWVEEYNRLIKQ